MRSLSVIYPIQCHLCVRFVVQFKFDMIGDLYVYNIIKWFYVEKEYDSFFFDK